MDFKQIVKGVSKLIKSISNKRRVYYLHFTKEDDNKWYIDLPDWPFDHHNLMMVAGADDLCEAFSHDGKHTKVSVIPSKEDKDIQSHDINERFQLKRTEWGLTEGATYQVQINQFKKFGAFIWLCPVTLFLLGEYPEYLYIKTLMKPLIKTSIVFLDDLFL